MQQNHNLAKTLPAVGAALSLASFGAASKAEAGIGPVSHELQKPAAVAPSQDLSAHTFIRFTDIDDFRKIFPPSDRPEFSPAALAAAAAAKQAPAKIAEIRSAPVPQPQNSEDGGGFLLAAAVPLAGAGKSSERKGFFGKLFSRGGGSGPDPEKDEKKSDPSPRVKPWASSSHAEQEQPHRGLYDSLKHMVSGSWKVWEKMTGIFPSPWNSLAKWGVPLVGATCGAVWFNTALHVCEIGAHMFGGLIEPLAGAAAFIIPMVTAGKILNGVEKLFKMDHIEGWKRQAILKPIQGALLVGGAIWIHAIGLAPITYGLWSAASVATGWAASKLFKHSKLATWTAVAAAITLPWAHIATQRTFDVTVLSAGPDPEVGAWNITTDLSKMDHWKSVAFFGRQAPPTGQSGMVFLNRDVPLYIPPHREANEFNGAFSHLIGKRVEITTIGAWLKPLSPKLQPTIVSYKVLGDATNAPAQK